jgi:hypothetical protein
MAAEPGITRTEIIDRASGHICVEVHTRRPRTEWTVHFDRRGRVAHGFQHVPPAGWRAGDAIPQAVSQAACRQAGALIR